MAGWWLLQSFHVEAYQDVPDAPSVSLLPSLRASPRTRGSRAKLPPCGKRVTTWCSVKTSYKPPSVLRSSFIETGNYLPQQYHQTVDMARFYGTILSDWLRSLA